MRLTRVHSRDDAFSIIRCRDQGCDSWGRTNLQPSGSRHKSMALHRVVQLSSRASQRTQKVQVLGGKSRVFLSEFLLLYPLLPHAQLVWTCGCARGHTDARCHDNFIDQCHEEFPKGFQFYWRRREIARQIGRAISYFQICKSSCAIFMHMQTYHTRVLSAPCPAGHQAYMHVQPYDKHKHESQIVQNSS